MKQIVFLLFALSFFMSTCKTQVLIKIKNGSREDFKKLYLNILGQEFYFDSIKSGKTTDFIKVDKTYTYCFARAITAKDTVLFFPTDYMGERLFTNGKLMITISILRIADERRHLEITSKRISF